MGAVTAARVVDVLALADLRFQNEADLQQRMEAAFTAAGFLFDREVNLDGDRHNRIDFLMAGGLGVEVKAGKSSSTMDVTRQLLRYTHARAVTGLLLVTTRALHAGVPRELGGKPVDVYTVRGMAF